MTLRKLTRKKISSAVRRRVFEFVIPRTRMTAAEGLVDAGSSYGGWIVPLEIIGPDWTCYCVGSGGDITFDRELARRGARVRAIEPVEEYVRAAELDAADEPLITAHRFAIAANDGPLRVQTHHHPESQSVSSADLYDTHDYTEVPGITLTSLMRALGDQQIDLLKLDLEGAEYEIVPRLDLRGLGVRVFALQAHHTGSVRQARQLIDDLRRQGYVPVGCRPVVKLTFRRIEDVTDSTDSLP